MSRSTQSVLTALYDALKDADLKRRDNAAVALAKKLAAQVDAGSTDVALKAAAQLLAVLAELGMTPRARKAVIAPPPGAEKPKTALDLIRDDVAGHAARN